MLVGDSDLIEIVPAGKHPPVGMFPKTYDAAAMSVKTMDEATRGDR